MEMRTRKLKTVVWLIVIWVILVISCNDGGGNKIGTDTPLAPSSPMASVQPTNPPDTPVSLLVATVSPAAPPAVTTPGSCARGLITASADFV